LEHYLTGSLDKDLKLQVEEHLSICSDCNESLDLLKMVESVISGEKDMESNPFLATRVMSVIEEIEKTDKDTVINTIFGRLLKPALITASLAASLILGIAMGNLIRPVYNSEQIPEEIAYLNDSYIESLELFAKE
jgi:hypothetical protein